MLTKRSGVMTSLVTPFRRRAGTNEPPPIDEAAFEAIVRAQVRAGVDAVIVAGWIGEGPTLTLEERGILLSIARSACRGRVAVLTDVGSCDTAKSIAFARDAASAGADGIVVVTPPYNKPNAAGFRRHVLGIAESTTLPILLEFDPERTRSPVTVRDMMGLMDIERIEGIVIHSGSPVHAECLGATRGATTFFAACEASCVASRALGADGIVSASANAVPASMVQLGLSCGTVQMDYARHIHEALFPLIHAVEEEGVPALKHAVARLYGMEATVRLPLVPVAAKTAARVDEAFALAAAMEEEIEAPRRLRFAR